MYLIFRPITHALSIQKRSKIIKNERALYRSENTVIESYFKTHLYNGAICLSASYSTHTGEIIWLKLSLVDPNQMLLRLCMNHDPCLIQLYTIMVPTDAPKYIKISLFTQWTKCFSQSCGHFKACKIQTLDTLTSMKWYCKTVRTNPWVMDWLLLKLFYFILFWCILSPWINFCT
jgi:hypothetical protein